LLLLSDTGSSSLRYSGMRIGGRFLLVFRGRQKLARDAYCGVPHSLVKSFLYCSYVKHLLLVGETPVHCAKAYGLLLTFAYNR